MKYDIKACALANAEHKHCKRSYAHVFHKPGVICVAGHLFAASENVWLGVILHEVGHIILEGQEHTEQDADKAVEVDSRVKIHRRDTEEGKNIEWVADTNIRRAGNYLDKWLKP
jgi:hypothetical protein